MSQKNFVEKENVPTFYQKVDMYICGNFLQIEAEHFRENAPETYVWNCIKFANVQDISRKKRAFSFQP